jgi:LmbE family N-acetylglucosaminyl deacetylase
MPDLDLDDRAAIVMAHPDDEVLWASAALGRVGRVVLAYEELPFHPGISEGRRRALDRFPRPVESLRLAETAAFGAAAWPDPVETATGLAVSAGPGTMRGFTAAAYHARFAELVARLRPALAGVRTVITHSPWGEYGHEDHVQLFRAVDALRPELGFAVWVPGYVSNRSAGLMLRNLGRLGPPTPPLPTDRDLGERLKALYRETGCWTWFDDYAWPEREVYYPVLPAPAAVPPGRAHPVSLVWLPAVRPPPPASMPHRLAAWVRRLR